MEFDHDVEAGRKWSATATKEAGCNCQWPKNSLDIREALMCPKSTYNGSKFEYYPTKCVSRECAKCSDSIDKFTCEKCRAASPYISCLEWLPVPYHCKDGRQLESHDFVKVRQLAWPGLELCVCCRATRALVISWQCLRVTANRSSPTTRGPSGKMKALRTCGETFTSTAPSTTHRPSAGSLQATSLVSAL